MRLWKTSPNGKPMRAGSIIADSDIHWWGWSAALLGWYAQGGDPTREESMSASRGLDYLARRMEEAVSFRSPDVCRVDYRLGGPRYA